MPLAVRMNLCPGEPLVRVHADHVEIRYYDYGVLAGPESFREDTGHFLAEIRPGIYVFLDEK